MRYRWVYIAYAAITVCLWPLPLLNVLHVESSAVVAAASFFVSGWAACSAFSSSSTPREWMRVTGRLLRALVVPWGMLTVSVLWAPNCGYVQGLGLFLLFVPLSTAFGTAVAYLLTGIGTARLALTRSPDAATPSPTRHSWLIGVGIVVMVGGLVFDYAFHSQFFSYNHVFGGILGPIYDEQLAIRPGLFWFRGMTVLWIVALVAVGARTRGFGGRWTQAALPATALLLGAGYFFSTTLGFNVTEASLKQALPGTLRTDHFEIHYDPSAHPREEVASWGRMQERAYADLADRLNADPAEEQRFLTFVYPSPEAKARLTGARTTSVAPVWLARAQSHLLVSRLEASFQHELAHLFSRPYGLPGLNASWSVGLVEGWAVALESPSLSPSPDDLVRAARGRTGLGDDLTKAVQARLSPLGFWTGRGAVSYTTMGSFVSYLRREYGAKRLKRVYAWANFDAVYGRSLADLTEEWAATLGADETIHASAGASADRQFSRLSLFETACPHHVPPYRRRLQEGRRLLEKGDTLAAENAFRAALAREPRSATAHVQLARLRLARGETSDVLTQLDRLAPEWKTPSVDIIRADVHARRGQVDSARVLYESTLAAWPDHATDLHAELLLRSLSAHHPFLVKVWTSRGTARMQAHQFAEYADARETGERASLLATVWAARRWAEAHQPNEAAKAWRRARQKVSPFSLEETMRSSGNEKQTSIFLRDAERVTQKLLESLPSISRSSVEAIHSDTSWPRGWRVRLSLQVAREMFVAELETMSVAVPAYGSLSWDMLAREAAAVADRMKSRGAEPYAHVWHHFAETARRQSEAFPVTHVSPE